MPGNNRHPLKIFTGNAHPALAHEIAQYLRVKVGRASVDRFPDGEVRLQILKTCAAPMCL